MQGKVGILALLAVAVGFFAIKQGSQLGQDQKRVSARLSNVRGMPVGAPVTIAGLEVGNIVERRVGPGYAEVDIVFDSRVVLREDAVLYKRRSSLLSGPALEIDPGNSEVPLDNAYIPRVVEGNPIGDVLFEISEALPTIQQKSEESLDTFEDLRASIDGPFREQVTKFGRASDSIGERMHTRLGQIQDALRRAETMDFDAQKSIEPAFARAEELTEFARDEMSKGRNWMQEQSETVQDKIENTKLDWSSYAEPLVAIDEGVGTLGKLVNSDDSYDTALELSTRVRSFVKGIVGWRMQVGFRGEYGVGSGQTRSYVTLQAGRPDRYYYMELLSSPRGQVPNASLQFDPSTRQWRRNLEISDSFRLTAQFARRFGPVVMRYGLKEGTFGFGSEADLLDSRLSLSADIFEFGQNDRPRLKVAATYRVFAQLYILAGIDDALNPKTRYQIAGQSPEETSLDSVVVGRDFYVGSSLRFTDRDLASLLAIGGQAIIGLLP